MSTAAWRFASITLNTDILRRDVPPDRLYRHQGYYNRSAGSGAISEGLTESDFAFSPQPRAGRIADCLHGRSSRTVRLVFVSRMSTVPGFTLSTLNLSANVSPSWIT